LEARFDIMQMPKGSYFLRLASKPPIPVGGLFIEGKFLETHNKNPTLGLARSQPVEVSRTFVTHHPFAARKKKTNNLENLEDQLKSKTPPQRLSISIPTNPPPREQVEAFPEEIKNFFYGHFKRYLPKFYTDSLEVDSMVDDSENLIAEISKMTVKKKISIPPYEDNALLKSKLSDTGRLLDVGDVKGAVEIAKTWLVGLSPSAIKNDKDLELAKELQLIFYRFARLNHPAAVELYKQILDTYNQDPVPPGDLSFIFTIMIVPLDRYADPTSTSPNIPKAIEIFRQYISPLFFKNSNNLSPLLFPCYVGEEGETFDYLNSVLKRFLKIKDPVLISQVHEFCVVLNLLADISDQRIRSSDQSEVSSQKSIIKRDDVNGIFLAAKLLLNVEKQEILEWLRGKTYDSLEDTLCVAFEVLGDHFLEKDPEIFDLFFTRFAHEINAKKPRQLKAFETALIYGGIQWQNKTKIFDQLFDECPLDSMVEAWYFHFRVRDEIRNFDLKYSHSVYHLFQCIKEKFERYHEVSKRSGFFKVLGKKLGEDKEISRENIIKAIRYLKTEFYTVCPFARQPALTCEENWQPEIDYYWLNFLQGLAEGLKKRNFEDLLLEYYSKTSYFDIFQVLDVLLTRVES
jgi:hypothetical protein